jgi:hypothetical protein
MFTVTVTYLIILAMLRCRFAWSCFRLYRPGDNDDTECVPIPVSVEDTRGSTAMLLHMVTVHEHNLYYFPLHTHTVIAGLRFLAISALNIHCSCNLLSHQKILVAFCTFCTSPLAPATTQLSAAVRRWESVHSSKCNTLDGGNNENTVFSWETRENTVFSWQTRLESYQLKTRCKGERALRLISEQYFSITWGKWNRSGSRPLMGFGISDVASTRLGQFHLLRTEETRLLLYHLH